MSEQDRIPPRVPLRFPPGHGCQKACKHCGRPFVTVIASRENCSICEPYKLPDNSSGPSTPIVTSAPETGRAPQLSNRDKIRAALKAGMETTIRRVV